jgi:hypothetical protein
MNATAARIERAHAMGIIECLLRDGKKLQADVVEPRNTVDG